MVFIELCVFISTGSTYSHKKLFESTREERMQRLAVPTNQIIIRLERLLANMPADPIKRKGTITAPYKL